MKKKLRLMTHYIAKIIGPVFFDKKYLEGRWFETIESRGWRWVWRSIIWQKIFGFNRNVPWPVSHSIVVQNPENVIFDINDLQMFQTYGTYFQSFSGKIIIGKGGHIAPNVGLINTNHDPAYLDSHLESRDIIIGENCWIGMNSIILPGVKLGNNTIVGAGSVITKSFPEGNCVIAGNPAKRVKSNFQRRDQQYGRERRIN